MAFTPITITGTWERPDGQPAQGKLSAILSAPMQNGTVLIDPTPIAGALNAAGQLKDASGSPFVLEANDDTGTTPTGTHYQFTLSLDGAALQEFTAVIPHTAAAGTVDLSALV